MICVNQHLAQLLLLAMIVTGCDQSGTTDRTAHAPHRAETKKDVKDDAIKDDTTVKDKRDSEGEGEGNPEPTIRGEVFATNNSTPVANVTIRLTNAGEVVETTTNNLGTFQFTNQVPGAGMSITAAKDCFGPQEKTGVSSDFVLFHITPHPVAAITGRMPEDGYTPLTPKLTLDLSWSADACAKSYWVEIDCLHCCQADTWCADIGKTHVLKNVTEPKFSSEFVGERPGRWRVWSVGETGIEGERSPWHNFDFSYINKPDEYKPKDR